MTTTVIDAAPPRPEPALTVLCVDDEANILNSLRRLLRPQGYEVLTADSGAAGLEILGQQQVDLVLSDMRMPEMDGAQFLAQVRTRSPDTTRILLTGYADLDSTIAAINNGQIYRYISKPWDDGALLGIVKDALERKLLEREKARLEALLARRNEELRELNSELEAKVEVRTADLAFALDRAEQLRDDLRKSFVTCIKIFSGLIEMREGARAGRSRRVADLARRIGKHMQLSPEDIHNLALAGLLHGIGKFGVSDALLCKGPTALTPEELKQIVKHPVNAQAVLMPLEQLHDPGEIIRSYRERYDGKGYPDALSGSAIPLGSRIIAVAHDYEAAQDGALTGVPFSKGEARQHIIAGRGNRYDPVVVDAFIAILQASGGSGIVDTGGGGAPGTRAGRIAERLCSVTQLRAGMVLTRDLVTSHRVVILSKDTVLDAGQIEKLVRFQSRDDVELRTYVRAP